MNNRYIAHYRSCDEVEQPLKKHLLQSSEICGVLADKLGMSDAGRLLGLLHDFGKYSCDFQVYIRSATGLLKSTDKQYVNAKALKGKIDHATAGAQWVWRHFSQYGPQGKLVGQILAMCLVSHHGGLIDCLTVNGENGFRKRIIKDDSKTNLAECLEAADEEIIDKIRKFNDTSTKEFVGYFCRQLANIIASGKKESPVIPQFKIGLFTRCLFSCLIDADRTNSADFEDPGNADVRSTGAVDWPAAIERMEAKSAGFSIRNEIDSIRYSISEQCRKRAGDGQGVYTLTVPTGGGKTFSSMRYALHHAQKHNLQHIIYIIPFTSIIEQNAEEIRKVIEREEDGFPWVLEHHSSLEPGEGDRAFKIATENWDRPIIFTTMVQFLNVLFDGGTGSARRMHALARSVLIFDEIQSLPVNCAHLFCNAVQFLVDHAKTTVVLCTATQPLLNDLKFPEKGQLYMPDGHELVENMAAVFERLKRVEIKNLVRSSGWTEEEIATLALERFAEKGNCLIIVNTKQWARKLYERCVLEVDDESIFHLSTNLCSAHRKEILAKVRGRLDAKLPVLCISTQLIEAGVDVDFNVVIRFLAGLDSIAQAAGRCNRNGNLPTAEVFVVNPGEEPIDKLTDIKIGRDKALRIFSEEDEANLLQPAVMTRYFQYYFHERADVMCYPLNEERAGRKDTLLSLLGDNHMNIGRKKDGLHLQQSFKTAGRAFRAIDAPTRAVIVPYGEGGEIIAELFAEHEPGEIAELLKRAQLYSVNIFPHILRSLVEEQAIRPVGEGLEIYCLNEQYYHEKFGLSMEVVSGMDMAIV